MRDEWHAGEPLGVQRGQYGRRRYRGLHGVHEVSGSADAGKLLWQRQHGVHHEWARPIRFDGMRPLSHANVDDGLFLNGSSEPEAGKSLLRPRCSSHGFEPCRWSHAGLSRWGRVPHGTALGPGTTSIFPSRRSHFRPVARDWRTLHGLRPPRRSAGRLRAVGGATGNSKVERAESVAEARHLELPSLVVSALGGLNLEPVIPSHFRVLGVRCWAHSRKTRARQLVVIRPFNFFPRNPMLNLSTTP